MKKQILALLLVLSMALSLVSCGGSTAEKEAAVSSADESVEVEPAEDESLESVADESSLADESAETSEDEFAPAEDEDSATSAEASAAETDEQEYDELQALFLSVEDGLTEESLLAAIEENGLYYRDEEGEESHYYKVAYTEGVARLSHADEGDKFEVSFYLSDGTVKSAEYFDESLFVSALYKSSKLESDYGYTDYSFSANKRDDGSDSGTASMNYYEASSLEDALHLALTVKAREAQSSRNNVQ
ncbi:MAG: hypothetical protein LUD78_10990 [Clostridiales bacterium]|nr:hypothetical protein [Clostridiales bacterium]